FITNNSSRSVADYVEKVNAMGIRAVWIAYILPFLLVLFLLLVLLQAGCGELISGVSALSVLVVYYVILYVARSRLSREFVFKVRKLNQQKL
ncbi:MAG TPA: SoxR reducing system RseC family protein, partial [Candidatus Alistipes pullicola]|nr:SoxR reducing system RseC family protein [Candidatus Alistipes pullicola]